MDNGQGFQDPEKSKERGAEEDTEMRVRGKTDELVTLDDVSSDATRGLGRRAWARRMAEEGPSWKVLFHSLLKSSLGPTHITATAVTRKFVN